MRSGKARASRLGQLVASVALLVSATLLSSTNAQAVRQQTDDPVTIVGTWATGSGQVETGLVSAVEMVFGKGIAPLTANVFLRISIIQSMSRSISQQ